MLVNIKILSEVKLQLYNCKKFYSIDSSKIITVAQWFNKYFCLKFEIASLGGELFEFGSFDTLICESLWNYTYVCMYELIYVLCMYACM